MKKLNNFWNSFPEILVHDFFDKYYNQDKSKDKEKSSTVMWAIYYYINPEGGLRNVPNKREIIKEKFVNDKTFNWDIYEEHIDRYKECVLSIGEQELYNWEELLRNRNSMLRELYQTEMEKDERNIANLDKIDKMMSNTNKLFSEYLTIKSKVEEENIKKGKGEVYTDEY